MPLRTLHDITQLLESVDGSGERVRRVLELMRGLVPYDQCALLQARLGDEPHMVAVPEPPFDERTDLMGTLLDLLGEIIDPPEPLQPLSRNARPHGPAARSAGAYLAVPLIGLDELIGLLLVRSTTEQYTENHLRTLSLVAAKLAAYLTTVRARAELAELARERDEARRAAEAANRAKDEFLALVSHELKTPLTSILAWAHVLSSTTDDTVRARAIEALEGNVRAQAKLIDDVLDLACISSATLRLHLRVIEPAALIKATVEGLRLEAERKSIRLDCNLDEEAIPLAIDPDRIGQVVSILVANAIDSTPAGGHVEVRLERTADCARIQVTDGGKGFSREALPHLFDRVGSAAGGAARAGGRLGVELAIARDLVEIHGGHVRAESAAPERGTTFTVELPRAPAGAAPGARSAGQRDGHGDRPLAGVSVLLVDHDPGLRESLESLLAEHGAEVIAVASAPEALAALERSRPDVLLFGDLAMHGETVYDLMREVTARACPLPIASISAWRLEETERERAAGFRLHLPKPIESNALVEAVADLAGRKRRKTQRLYALPRDPSTLSKRRE